MDDQAYLALDAIHCGNRRKIAARRPWIEAIKAVQWAVEADGSGLILTEAGIQAYQRLSRGRDARRR